MLVRFPQPADCYEVAEFPCVTGCVDYTHVRINSPGVDNAEVFRNRKGYFCFSITRRHFPSLKVKKKLTRCCVRVPRLSFRPV